MIFNRGEMHHWSLSCAVVALAYVGGKYLSAELRVGRFKSVIKLLFLIMASQNSEKQKQEFFIFNGVVLLPLEQHLFLAASESKTKGVSIKTELSH